MLIKKLKIFWGCNLFKNKLASKFNECETYLTKKVVNDMKIFDF